MALLQVPTVALSRISSKNSFFWGYAKSIPSPLCTERPSSRMLVLRFSRRQQNRMSPPTSKTIDKRILTQKNVEKDDNDIDEDAFEALFSQLEEDLKNDELFDDDDENDGIDEEELAKLENELAEALTDVEFLGAFGSVVGGENNNELENEELDDAEADDEDKSQVKLKNWQLRRLAHAFKKGRRKTSIKNLAADLCLDRSVVLKLLREPPPNLVILSAALPDNPVLTSMEPSEENIMANDPVTTPPAAKPKVEGKIKVNEMQSNWSARKRLKKVQIETLEQVYRRTKRPTNSMISSIVHVTNLPGKRVVKWFEDKRAEDGVPENRSPYKRSASATVFTTENSLGASSKHIAAH